MSSTLPKGSVQEYVPSWMKKPAAAASAPVPAMSLPPPLPQAPPYVPFASGAAKVFSSPPPPMPDARQRLTSTLNVTRTSTNQTSSVTPQLRAGYTPVSRPVSSPMQQANALGTRSPIISKYVPVRMSPAIAPSKNHMNPSAAEFIPGSSGLAGGLLHGLEILPTSTADLELQGGVGAAVGGGAGPVLLGEKTEAEIREISKRSIFKVEAAAYMPRRTLARVVLAKPSPLVLTPSADPTKEGIELMFNDLWCLFYLSTRWGENIKEEDYNPTLVFRIDTIPNFWKVFNNISPPADMTMSTLYLFRDGINPRWEDESNRDGGIVKAKIPADRVNEAWELLLCRTVGDSWSPAVRNTVNGICLKVRDHGYLVELWVTKNSPDLTRDLAELWQPLLGNAFATTYLTHAVIQERSQAAAAAALEKRKNQRRRF